MECNVTDDPYSRNRMIEDLAGIISSTDADMRCDRVSGNIVTFVMDRLPPSVPSHVRDEGSLAPPTDSSTRGPFRVSESAP